MQVLKVILAFVVMLAVALPASAAWTEVSSSWNPQGLGSGWGLVSDGTGLYAFNGTLAKVYNAGVWSDVTSAGKTAYTNGSDNTIVFYEGGKFYMKRHQENVAAPWISIFDTADNSWDQVDYALGDFTHNYSQGGVYNPNTETFWAFWTSGDPAASMVEAGYDGTNWSTATEIDYGSNYYKFHNANPGVIVGDYYYHLNQQDGNSAPWMQKVSMDWGSDPTASVQSNVAQASFSASLGSSWGCRIMAAFGNDIYVTGAGDSGVFAVFHTDTSEWEELDSYTNGSGGGRDHTMVVADGVIYVQDGTQFFAYAIPEPATMSLLGLGGLGLLLRRRRK